MALTSSAPSDQAWGTDAKPERLALALVTLGIISTAFNDLVGILPIGELSNDAFIYVAPLIFMYLALRLGSVTLPTTPVVLVIAFYVVILLGLASNYQEISVAYFKGRSGFSRAVTQAISVTFGILVTVAFYNLARRGFLGAISKGARIAILVMAAVGLLEFASWYSILGLTQIHLGLAQIIHANSGAEYGNRLRATAFEVSWAGVMLTFLFPFAIMDLPRHDIRRMVYIGLVFGLVVLARSRTAMLVIGGQSLLLLWCALRGRADRTMHVASVICLGLMLLMITPSVREAIGERLVNLVQYGSFVDESKVDESNVSNATRLAAINAGIGMFNDHPILGVGLGQYGFSYPKYLKASEFTSWEVRLYSIGAEPDWPPIFSLHVRILAELGIIGYLIWAALIAYPLWRSLRSIDLDTPVGRAHLAVAMTLSGWMLLGFSIDSFRFFGGWIALGVGLSLPAKPRRRNAP